MNTASAAPRPGSFRVVAIVLLLWNLFGVYMFHMQYNMPPDAIAALPDGQRTLWENMPSWMWGVYGVAVVSGALGALLLLLGKRAALPLFWVSLVAIVVQFAQVFFPGGALELLGPAMALPMPALIALVALFQVWYTRRARGRGWLA